MLMVAIEMINDVVVAADRLAGRHVRTPLLEYPLINFQVGGRILFKAENLQRTGSFKFRGAYNKISSLSDQERARGVVTFSSGNHGQGVAAAATIFGIPSTIVMPADAPALKRENTARYGGTVVLYDRHTGDRKAIAEDIMARTGAIMVPPYDDHEVIAGQGTVGLEIAQQAKEQAVTPDLILCPAGGGGLVAGLSVATRALIPDAQVWCVEPEGFDDTRRSLAAGGRVANAPEARSICDSIVTMTPGELTFPINKTNLSGGLTVTDRDVVAAMDMLFEMTKLVVEPGGAVGLAALISGQTTLNGRTAVVVLSGGNVDLTTFRGRFA